MTADAKARRVEEMYQASVAAMDERNRAAGERMVAELWHEDCEWVPLIAGVEGGSTYRGREGVLRFFDDLTASFAVRYRDVEFRQLGDTVVFLSVMELRGHESGVEVERELGVVYEFDGDRIRRGVAYDSHAAALQAAEAVRA